MRPAYSRRFDEAVALALDAFRHEVRKGTHVPYMTHLLAVTALVGEHGGDEDQLIAAVLHDWLEDIEGSSVEVLTERFGPRVAGLVVALTDATERPKPAWRERKERYLAHLAIEPADVKLISAADKLHNCRSIRRDHLAMGDAIYDRFTGRKEGTLWYYRAVVEALAVGWSSPLLDELRREVEALVAAA